jgi:hypothetical protein
VKVFLKTNKIRKINLWLEKTLVALSRPDSPPVPSPAACPPKPSAFQKGPNFEAGTLDDTLA